MFGCLYSCLGVITLKNVVSFALFFAFHLIGLTRVPIILSIFFVLSGLAFTKGENVLIALTFGEDFFSFWIMMNQNLGLMTQIVFFQARLLSHFAAV